MGTVWNGFYLRQSGADGIRYHKALAMASSWRSAAAYSFGASSR